MDVAGVMAVVDGSEEDWDDAEEDASSSLREEATEATEEDSEAAASEVTAVTVLAIPSVAKLNGNFSTVSLIAAGERDGIGRYLTHQKASQRPLSITRFFTIYATTKRKKASDVRMSIRSSQSAFSRETMRFLEVVRRVPKAV